MFRRLLIGALAVIVSTPLAAETLERQLERRAIYEAHAGSAVDAIRSYRLFDWRPLGRDAFAVLTRPNGGAYLVEVAGPCVGLDWARTIGFTGTGATVSARFDRVVFDDQRCIIERIRPVDYAAVRVEEKALREARRRR